MLKPSARLLCCVRKTPGSSEFGVLTTKRSSLRAGAILVVLVDDGLSQLFVLFLINGALFVSRIQILKLLAHGGRLRVLIGVPARATWQHHDRTIRGHQHCKQPEALLTGLGVH